MYGLINAFLPQATGAVPIGYLYISKSKWQRKRRQKIEDHFITLWGLNKMTAILSTTFSGAFSWIRIIVFWSKSSWPSYVALMINQGNLNVFQWRWAEKSIVLTQTEHCWNVTPICANGIHRFLVHGRGAVLFFLDNLSNFKFTRANKLTIWLRFEQDY